MSHNVNFGQKSQAEVRKPPRVELMIDGDAVEITAGLTHRHNTGEKVIHIDLIRVIDEKKTDAGPPHKYYIVACKDGGFRGDYVRAMDERNACRIFGQLNPGMEIIEVAQV